MEKIIALIVLIIVAYLGFGLYLYVFQEHFVFPGAFVKTPTYPKPAWMEEINVKTRDDKFLVVWANKDFDPKKPTCVYFHGNFENISSRIDLYERLLPTCNILAPSYRGYYGPSYKPSVANLYNDTDDFLTYFKKNVKTWVVIGYSLGGAPATYFASRQHVSRLILYSTFVDLRTVVSNHLIYRFFLPFLKFDLPNIHYLSNVKAEKVAIVHGGDDLVVSPKNFEIFRKTFNVYTNFNFYFYESADHGNIIEISWQDISMFLSSVPLSS
ncbi:MAG: alpha/beta hydrolase [Deltaproteobacteria bacterium]|nr:alpha/beta hydrolase [Deltaproteobacteria bacterium]